ncbi:la-related protein 1C-like isoform X3 [Raphanus sativus]|nr:la-related protein 1C-like isoform X3 [Raphanus sativus]XP_018454877.1 la-related protein 1C-like isoform X3 [Raphanus sativus]
MEKEKSDKSEMFQGNAENKPAWNRFSNGGSQIKPLVVASSSWPLLSEAKKSAPCSNKSSSDALKSLCHDGSSSSVSLFSKQTSGPSVTTALTVSIMSVSSASSMKIMEKEKSEPSEMFEGNAGNKPAKNKQIMEALSWPSLTETGKTAPCSNKSSTDTLKSLGCDGSSSSSTSFFFQPSSFLAETERMLQESIEQAIALTRDTVVQPSGESSYGNPLPYTSPRGHNQGNEFASGSHVSTETQHQQNSYKNQNVSHQSHGGRQKQEHVKQNWNRQGNFNELGGFPPPPSGGTSPAFVRPAQHFPVQHYFYPMAFTNFPPPMMYHPHRMSFIDPLPVLFPSQFPDRRPSIEPPPALVPSQKAPFKTKILNKVQEAPLKTKILNQDKEAPLKTKILNQVQYYLSEDNLPNDVYLRQRMNDEGFVHIEFIAGFNKLKALTSNVQLILDSLRDSDIVEVQGYEIRNRRVWRKYVMSHEWRVTFYPSQEYVMANNYQNMQLEQN